MTLLATWLWQGMLIATATIACLRCATRLNATSRYVIAWAGLAAVLVLPVPGILAALAPAGNLPSSTAAVVPAEGVLAPLVVTLPDWLVSIAVGVWLGTVIVGGLRLGLGLRTVVRLRATSHPMSADRQAQLPLWAALGRHGRGAELRVSASVSGACAIGLLHPMIIVSDRLCDVLSDDDLDRVVIHEYAHLTRHDDWGTLAQAVIGMAAGLHPAVRWLFRQIDLEREAACDDRVVTLTGDARPYAACLTTVAAVTRYCRFDDALAPSVTRTRSTLHARVVRLLDADRRREDTIERPPVVLAGFVVALGVMLSSQLSPLVVFLEAKAGTAIQTAVPDRSRHTAVIRPDSILSQQSQSPVDRPVTTPNSSDGRRDRPRVLTASAPVARANVYAAPDASRPPAVALASTGAGLQVPLRTTHYALLTIHAPAPAIESESVPRLSDDGGDQPPSNPWVMTGQRAAAVGVAAGSGVKRAGTSIAGFFTRASKALARSF